MRDALETVPSAAPGPAVPLAEAELLAPLAPGTLLGIGLNYRDHAAETGAELPIQPLLFAKLVSSVTGPGGEVVRPGYTDELDYEGELAVVIGRAARDVPAGRALDHVFGYAVMNDLSRATASARAPVDPRQGRRRLRPVRPLDHDGGRGARPPGAVHPHLGQRRAAPGRHDPRHGLLGGRADRLLLVELHPAPGRRDHHRHPGRRRRRPGSEGVSPARRPRAGRDPRARGVLEHAIR